MLVCDLPAGRDAPDIGDLERLEETQRVQLFESLRYRVPSSSRDNDCLNMRS